MRTLLILTLFLCAKSVLAQSYFKLPSNAHVCAADTGVISQWRYRVYPASAEATKMISDLCAKMGVNMKLFTLQAAEVPNAQAVRTEDGKKYIHYNPQYLNRIKRSAQTKWVVTYVLAHEIGHHISDHTLPTVGSELRREQELEADVFAGCRLRQMGATLEQLEAALEVLNEKGSETHPPRSERSVAAQSGYESCAPPPSPTSGGTPPPPAPLTDEKIPCNRSTGHLVFTNKTTSTIQVIIKDGNERDWKLHKMIQVYPGDTQSFSDLPAQLIRFEIRKNESIATFTSFYKEVQGKPKPCDEHPNPIVIQ